MHFFEKTIHNFGAIDYTALPWVVLGLIGLALLFDFLNGLHDAAHSIATVVSTRVLTPQQAVLWAAFFNFVAFLVFNLNVAGTIGKEILNPDPKYVTNAVIAGTLIGACAWNILTWYWGLPTSSSHALIGGLVGAALVHTGWAGLLGGRILDAGGFHPHRADARVDRRAGDHGGRLLDRALVRCPAAHGRFAFSPRAAPFGRPLQ